MASNDAATREKTTEADEYLLGQGIKREDLNKITAQTRRMVHVFMEIEGVSTTRRKDLADTVSQALGAIVLGGNQQVGTKSFASRLRDIGCKTAGGQSTLEAMCNGLEAISE